MEKRGKMDVKRERTVEDELRRLNVLYSPDEATVSEEESEFRYSTSAMTDSFRERLSSCEGLDLLEDFLKVLDSWAKKEEAEEGSPAVEVEEGPYGAGESEGEGAMEEEGREEEGREEEGGEEEMEEVETSKEAATFPADKEVRVTKEELKEETGKRETKAKVEEINEDEKMRLMDSKRMFAYRLLGKDAPKMIEELDFFTQEDGLIQVKDIAYTLRSFGCNPTEREIGQICQSILIEHGDKIDKVSFLSYLLDQQRKTYTTKDILGAFKSLDVKNAGKIRNRLLRNLLSERRERLNVEELSALFREGDPTKSGFIDYGEFVRRMDRNIYIAIPEKRRYLVKMLRREDKRGGRDSTEHSERSTVDMGSSIIA